MVTAFLLTSLLGVSSGGVEIRVVPGEGWAGAPPQNIEAVLQSTAQDMLKFFPDRKLREIVVEFREGPPITLYELGPNGETQIHLSSRGLYWSQYAYQFAHELTHVLAGYGQVKPNSPPNVWFEESICMMGSLFVMRQMSETWKTNPPYSNWKDYAPNLASYANAVMTDPKHQLADGQTLAQWYKANKEQLKSGGGSRQMQSVVANVLLPLFERSPEHWPAVGYLNMKPTGDASFETYLDAWEESSPAKHRLFIRSVRAKFGVPTKPL